MARAGRAPAQAVEAPPSTRRRILDAAAELIARDGTEVSMEAIAERAGVTRMTVYRKLGTREELLVAVLLDQSRVVVDGLMELLGDERRPFAERVVDAVVLVVMTARTSPVLRVYAQNITPRQVDELDREDRFLGAVWALFLPSFEAAEARGELRAPARRTLDWVLRQILLQLTVPGSFGDDEAALRTELDLFLVPALRP